MYFSKSGQYLQHQILLLCKPYETEFSIVDKCTAIRYFYCTFYKGESILSDAQSLKKPQKAPMMSTSSLTTTDGGGGSQSSVLSFFVVRAAVCCRRELKCESPGSSSWSRIQSMKYTYAEELVEYIQRKQPPSVSQHRRSSSGAIRGYDRLSPLFPSRPTPLHENWCLNMTHWAWKSNFESENVSNLRFILQC